MPKNVTVDVNGVVGDKLKLTAEAFAIKVFENLDTVMEYPDALYVALAIYEHSIESEPLTPIQNFN